MKKRKTKAQLEQERREREARWEARRLEKDKRDDQKRTEAARRERSKPRTEMPSAYAGESIYVHKRVLDGFMKQFGKKLDLVSSRVVGGSGGKLVIQYTTKYGGSGVLELKDLGPMPIS